MSTCTLYVTFGHQYAREPHPRFPLAHPDGWLTLIIADCERTDAEAEARHMLMHLLDNRYAFLYDTITDDDRRMFFPRGELACLSWRKRPDHEAPSRHVSRTAPAGT